MKINFRNIIISLIILMLICILTACQPTPYEQVITQKDDIEELIQNTASPADNDETQTADTPEEHNGDEPQPTEAEEVARKYQKTLEYQDGTFKVVIDAVIDKPGTPVPVVKVEPYMFTREDADRALELFMPGKSIYEFKSEYSNVKELLQQQIFELEETKAKIKSVNELDEQTKSSLVGSYSSWINQLEDIAKNASDDVPEWKQVTTEFVDQGYERTGLFVKADVETAWPAFFSLSVFDDGIKSLMSFSNVGNVFGPSGVRKINEDIMGMETTFAEAQALAEDAMKSLGVEDFKFEYAELGTLHFFTDEEVFENEYVPKCYLLHFVPEINGIKAREMQTCKGFDIEGVEYNVVWNSERLTVYVNDTGVIVYSHFYPGKITETVNDNVEVLDFDEAMEIFEKQIFYEGVWTASNVSYSNMIITKIQMSMFRLKLQDKDEFMYVPVWDFIGTWETDNYGTEPGKEICFLTINAIDGSIINRNLGY